LKRWIAGLGALAVLAVSPAVAAAHQPFFEETDWTWQAGYRIADPSISTALYAQLDRAGDVDVVTFDGKAGQAVTVRIDVPQLPGLEAFAPTVALLGPGLPHAALPPEVTPPAASGALVLAPPPGPAPVFRERFTGTSYWTRQNQRVTLPETGMYTLAVYHPQGETGKYVLSVGDREVRGGDPQFRSKLKRYFGR
jgi:hypothetical protein